ncbi:hypothetical protein PV327_010031 [Microctonus hyperodae]|uniref:Uncharacterized protein n=1 Tax=Microctonus hyperodae TaxID=165561 RepID=A0AA39KGC5_MICHY|nr:hypothetical protein PV327_010031 [Microctonus hyperodae]
MMSEYCETVNKSDVSVWDKPPCPTSPFTDRIVATVPDISLCHNEHTSPSTNSKCITNKYESKQTNKFQYPHDSRLRFYQILESNANHNRLKERNCTTNDQRYSLSQNRNDAVVEQCKNYAVSSKFVPNPSIRYNNYGMNEYYNEENKQKENTQIHCASNTNPHYNWNYPCNNRTGNNSIMKLLTLVERQNQQLESLKSQINALVSNLNKYRDHDTKTSSHVTGNEIKSFKSMRLQQKSRCSEEVRTVLEDNKVSIGVMTSFEFTICNKSNDRSVEDATAKNCSPLVENCRGESLHSLKSPLEKIIEKSECQVSENADRHIINYNEEQNNPIEKVDCYVDNDNDESVKVTSAKIGWTFYNNVLCHVNEILHNSNEIRQPQTECNMTRKSNTDQMILLEAAFADITNAITSNINDKLIAVDSSYYPRVNYQTNIIQTSNSTSETNASIHMRALALKYLGDEYVARNDLSQKQMNELTKSHSIMDIILKNTTSISTRNYMDKHKLMGNERLITNDNMNLGKQNILDVSILKRQPKLL